MKKLNSKDQSENWVVFDHLHIVLWLLKDMCWAMEWKTMGVIMVVPTLALAVYISLRTNTKSFSFLPNLSILCWILANSIWMFDEFFHLEIRHLCLVFFGAGLAMVFYWLIAQFAEIKIRFRNSLGR